MKTITNDYKTEVKSFGRQLDSIISYELNGATIELGKEDLNSVTLRYEGSILKSVMKQLDIDSNVEIPLKTVLNYQFGVFTGEEYEYINLGNFVVYKVEKQEDTSSYKITCYDKMLYAMKDYQSLEVEYPITVRSYIEELCNKLGLTFKNSESEFVNYDKEISNEVFLDASGSSLGYTYRDVLDQLAEVTASTICVDNNDQLEIRYITETNDTINEEFLKSINVNFGKKYGPINSIVLSRSAGSDNIYRQDEDSIEENGLCELKISDNQIMNNNDRDIYIDEIFTKLNGLEYYLNDYASTGITYYELCDRYNVQIGEQTYSCVMFNDEINVTQGLEEHVETIEPEVTETEYKKADKTDQRINQAYLIVDKVSGQIEGVVSKTTELDTTVNNNYQEIIQKFGDYAPESAVIELQNTVTNIQTDTYTRTEIDTKLVDGSVEKVQTISGTFDINGMTYEKAEAPTKTTINEVGVSVKDQQDNQILFSGYVDENNTQYSEYKGQTIVASENIIVANYFVMPSAHSRIEDYEDGGGMFYV